MELEEECETDDLSSDQEAGLQAAHSRRVVRVVAADTAVLNSSFHRRGNDCGTMGFYYL